MHISFIRMKGVCRGVRGYSGTAGASEGRGRGEGGDTARDDS